MTGIKQNILAIQAEVINAIEQNQGLLSRCIKGVKEKLSASIALAKEDKDGLTQLYCCMVETHLNTFCGDAAELVDTIENITETDTNFILVKEKGNDYSDNTILLDADTYGLYYALNDHYSQVWNKEEYELSKNGSKGNPIITNLIKMFYQDDSGLPVYHVSDAGYVEKVRRRNREETNIVQTELFKSFARHDTKVFTDTSMAFVGGGGEAYVDFIIKLADQFDSKRFINLAPSMGAPELDIDSAIHITDQENILVDYVISSNVLNAFDHHLEHNKRDEVFAASAKILKQGGKAIHLMEKTSQQSHFNVNLNRSMHTSIGQDLIYSFFREKGAMDLKLEKKIKDTQIENDLISDAEFIFLDDNNHGNSDHSNFKNDMKNMFIDHVKKVGKKYVEQATESFLDGKTDDFRTSMMVMYQSSKPEITSETINKTKSQMNDYKNRFNYYTKAVYCSKPNVILD